MNRDFFLNAGLQFEPSPEVSLLPEHTANDRIFRPNWGKSDQYSRFESAMSSMVSSPVSNSNISNDIVAVRELVGKLNGEFSPAAMKLNLPIMDHFVNTSLTGIQNSMPLSQNLPLIAADPGFAERAAKFSCFGSRSFNGRADQMGMNSNKSETRLESNVSPVMSTGKFPRVSSSPALRIDRSPVGFEENKNPDEINVKLSRLSASAANSNEESSVSEQITIREHGFKNRKDSTSRKRSFTTRKGEEAIDDSKRSKKTEQENTEPLEPLKDYIHVRARRGQATDSHSLAERVRREKISERMKLLQNLVPNCNKVTGKALMLDEIINYVQSLQRQVEFLSMKLATVNPSLDLVTDDIISQHINQSNRSLSQQALTFYQENPQELFNESTPMTQSTQPMHGFSEHFSNFRGFGQDDLQSIVGMGFGENFDFDTALLHPIVDQPSDMNIEL